MASQRWPHAALATAAALIAALTVAGCVALPSAGPVQSLPVTQGPNAQAQPYVQIVSGPPRPGWGPQAIVQGFLTASASFGDNEQVALQYLTQQGRKEWNPSWSAVVYKEGPTVSAPSYPPQPKPTAAKPATPSPTASATATAKGATAKGKAAKPPQTATVTITGKVQASLDGEGSYAVPARASGEPPPQPSFQLVKVAGQWRINVAPNEFLLTAGSFQNDYELRNLYFFDLQTRFLVPDPVYVPMQATPADLMGGLVTDLIKQPEDWLAAGTKTAFPAGTKAIGTVSLNGPTAVVNLGGALAGASRSVKDQVSSQLFWTLSGAGQGGQAVQSVEVLINGKPYTPSWNQNSPVQAKSKYNPATGASASNTFYYLGTGGVVFSQAGAQGTPVPGPRIGTKFDQIAASPDGKFLAAVTATGGDLYTGLFGGPLTKRAGSGYTSVSWDPSDNLWAAANGQVVVLPSGTSRLLTVDGVANVTALQVAPDGVRVAMITRVAMVTSDEELEFGAISWLQGTRPGQATPLISLPQGGGQSLANLRTVSWYGPDDVITLANPGATPSVTEYPVNGGEPTAIPTVPGMEWISASWGSGLIAGLSGGHMLADQKLTGSWAPISSPGTTPVYPG